MSEMHKNLVNLAIRAIDEVFGDTSVSQEDTLDSLASLKDFIQMNMNAIEEDLRNS